MKTQVSEVERKAAPDSGRGSPNKIRLISCPNRVGIARDANMTALEAVGLAQMSIAVRNSESPLAQKSALPQREVIALISETG